MNEILTIVLWCGLLSLVRAAWLSHKAYYAHNFISGVVLDMASEKYWWAAIVMIIGPCLYWVEL